MEWFPGLLYLNFKDFFRSLFHFPHSEQAPHYPVCTVFMQIYLILYLIQQPQLSGLSSPTWLTIFFPYCWIKFARSDRKQLIAKREKERRGVGKMGKGAREKGRDRGRENKCLRLICYAYSRWQSSPVSLSGESHGKIIPRIEGPGRLQSMGL